MACWVRKNSNSTATLRAKQLRKVFKDFVRWNQLYHKKNTKTDKKCKKACSLSCPARVVIHAHYQRYMLQKPNVWQVKLT